MGYSKKEKYSICDGCGKIETNSNIYARKAWTLKKGRLLCPMCNGNAPKSTVKMKDKGDLLTG